MHSFVAIDFETANHERTSVCSVGIAVVQNGEITKRHYALIRPEPEYYNWKNTQVHGLTMEDTENSKNFRDVWAEIVQIIGDLPLVAHNKSFDESCLKAVFRCYQMDYPDYKFFCTCQAARRAFPTLKNHQLHTVSKHIGFVLQNHHHALADAEACAAIAIKIFSTTT